MKTAQNSGEAASATDSKAYLKFLDGEVDWYRWHANKARLLFILLRLVLTVLSAALPALAAIDSERSRPWLTGASITIAILAALDTQFKWGDEWRQYRTTQMALERLLRVYRQEVYAPGISTEDRFRKFVHEAEALIARDAESFFKFRITAWQENAGTD